MNATLPPIINAYVKASNEHDSAAVAACFSVDAVVHDEGGDIRGPEAIKAWKEHVIEKYDMTLEVIGVEARANEVALKARVSGNFEGSPVDLTHVFRMAGEKIADLRID